MAIQFDKLLKVLLLTSILTTVNCQANPNYPGGYSYNYGPWYSVYYGQQANQQNYYQQPNQPYGVQPQANNPASYWSNYDFRQNYDPKDYKSVTLPPSFRYEKPILDSYERDVSVQTGLGTVLGKKVYMFDSPNVPYWDRPGANRPVADVRHNVSAFYGIPYAKPPVEVLRFKPPEKYGRLQSHSAIEYRSPCPQPLNVQDPSMKPYHNFREDCLYLNVFTPDTRAGYFPVMVYIHGGEFEFGSGNWFPGHMLAASQEVVVVTFNYRLGALGFLSTGDSVSPGNYGMLDQVMAIHWVYEQIRYFHGDPDRITLFGPGAGAASAGLHMVSPLTRNIIRRVIGQSGSPLADWAAITNLERARNTSRIFGTKLGCQTTSSQKLVDCLKQRSARELSEFNFKADLGFFPWAPVVDRDIPNMRSENRFLPDTPKTLFLSRHFNPHTEYLSGVTEGEAAYLLLHDSVMMIHNYVVTQEYINRKIKEYILQYNYTLNSDQVYQAMSFMYTYWADPYNPVRIRDEYVNMMSDALFKAPNDDMVKVMLVREAKVFMYVLNSTVDAFNWDRWRRTPHDTEYYFLSGAPFMEPSFYPPDTMMDLGLNGYSENDRLMSAFFMQAFANFAKHGLPSSKIFGFEWKPMVLRPERTLYYLNVNSANNSTIKQDYRQRESAFWTSYLPTLIGQPPPTTPLPMEQQLDFQIGFYGAISAAILFFVLFIIGCALYCGSSNRKRDYYDDDDYSTNHTDLNIINEKNESRYESQQHTTV